MNHRQLMNLSIPTRIVVLVLTLRFNSYKGSIPTTIHQKFMQRNYESYKELHGSLQRNYTSKNFTSNIRATKHQTTSITSAIIVLHSFPNVMQKKLLNLLCQTMILLLLNIMTIVKSIIAGTS